MPALFRILAPFSPFERERWKPTSGDDVSTEIKEIRPSFDGSGIANFLPSEGAAVIVVDNLSDWLKEFSTLLWVAELLAPDFQAIEVPLIILSITSSFR